MMDQKNVTVSLPTGLLREARHLAVDQGLSLSRFLALLLEERIEAARRRKEALGRQRLQLEQGLPLGTGGKAGWDREALHER
ncbi:MAG: CopG family transcriptional regulator [Dehalococcoidia bacterium]|nr:CopG family transcriptional regulator [Dehalococcoidia bacterium]